MPQKVNNFKKRTNSLSGRYMTLTSVRFLIVTGRMFILLRFFNNFIVFWAIQVYRLLLYYQVVFRKNTRVRNGFCRISRCSQEGVSFSHVALPMSHVQHIADVCHLLFADKGEVRHAFYSCESCSLYLNKLENWNTLCLSRSKAILGHLGL